MEWLKQQPDTSRQTGTGDTSVLNLLETLQAKHIVIEPIGSSLFTTFALSQQSGSIGITSDGAKPSSSVMYPGTDKPPLILSKDNQYRSALFITIADQEFLASASMDNIRLWNPVHNTSKVVYKSEEIGRLCVIDERTVAWVAEFPSSNDLIHIHILNTDAEMWTLSSTLSVKATDSVSDISHVKTSDGTACFLLSFRLNGVIQFIEMVGGRVRWQVDNQQIDGSFRSWSICTDCSTVFVVDPVQNRLHLLSVEDGSVLRSINLRPLGIDYPGCVRLQGERLYIGHMNDKCDAYCISKFIKPTDV